jgi:hypothetical protein
VSMCGTLGGRARTGVLRVDVPEQPVMPTKLRYELRCSPRAPFPRNGIVLGHRHDTDGIRLEIEVPGCRSRVRRSTEPNWRHAGQENVSHG